MHLIKQKNKLIRSERKLVNKLGSIDLYKNIMTLINFFFSPVKIFLTISGKGIKKIGGVISLSTYKVFGKRIGYIDDFIIHKKTRGQGLGKKLMDSALKNSNKNKHDYITLVSESERTASHHLYKKIGFTVISFGAFIFAYKKIKQKK